MQNWVPFDNLFYLPILVSVYQSDIGLVYCSDITLEDIMRANIFEIDNVKPSDEIRVEFYCQQDLSTGSWI